MPAKLTYDPEVHDEAVLLSAAGGATWEAIAAACGKSVTTVKAWADPETGHPSFSEAVRKAQSAANDIAKGKLWNNVIGAESRTKTTERVVERVLPPKNARERARLEAEGLIDEEGLILVYKEKEVETVTKHKGDLGAQVMWLCNRRPDEWKSVNRIEGSGKDGAVLVRIVDDVPADA